MAKKCQIDETLLVDYLDDNLGEQVRADIEKHIERCAACRGIIETQRQWFSLVRQSRLDDVQNRTIDAQTLARLQMRVKTEINQEQQAVQNEKKGWRKPVFWLQAAGFAAAVLVVVLTLPMLLNLWQGTRSISTTGQIDPLNDLSINGTTKGATVGNMTGEGAGVLNMADTDQTWQVYKGSLAEINAMSCFFQNDVQTGTTETMTETTQVDDPTERDERKNGGSDPCSDMTLSNYFASAGRALNLQGRELLDVMSDAQKLRVIVKAAEPDQAMIIAGFSDDTAENYAEQLQESFKTCQTPIRIEIIRHDEMFSRLEQAEPGLYDRTFTEMPEMDMTWILILIGA
jgi:hypothetical protein